VRNRRRVVYYAILLLLKKGELLGKRNYIIIIFLEYDNMPFQAALQLLPPSKSFTHDHPPVFPLPYMLP